MSETGAHSRWDLSGGWEDSDEYRAAGRRMALAEAVHHQRSTHGWDEAELAERTGLTEDLIELIECSGAYPTLDLLQLLGTAFHADASLEVAEPGQTGLVFTPRAA
jgi:transcriptional regulator with XRE-family HTH domain